MDNTTEKTETTAKAEAPAPKTPPKRRINAGVKKAPASKSSVKKETAAKAPAKAKAAPEPKVNSHVEAGLNFQRYTGPSKFINGNRRVRVQVGGRTAITDRAAQGLYALRECYGSKAFQPKGFDNGILRRLLGEGLITASGGKKETIDGLPYLIDGEKPVTFKITAKGMGYGKA